MKVTEHPPYAPSLMESTRAIGYSLEAAISDIIDNSISAYAKKVYVDYFPTHDLGSYISILDDGTGMSEDHLQEAMRYGCQNPNDARDPNDLGRYGLGLKTASLSQCRKLTVLTKQNGIIYGRSWDLDYIIEQNSWALLILEHEDMISLPGYEKLEKQEHGTLVLWQKLDKLFIGESDPENALAKKMSPVREHLALVFHRYLTGEPGLKKIELLINNRSVEPANPFLSGKNTQLMDEEVIDIHGEKVIIKPFILPHISKLTKNEIDMLGGKDGLRRLQGFYVYRNKRLLVWGTWFRLMRQGDLSKLSRVQVDIPNSLDELWTLDVKKSAAIPPEEVRKNLSLIIKKITDGSKRTWTYRGKKEVHDPDNKLWNRIISRDNEISYEINTAHPLIEELFSSCPNKKILLRSLFLQIQGSLPLNHLYIDLTNDEKIANESSISDENILKLLKSSLDEMDSLNKRVALLEILKKAEPFCEYIEVIDKAIELGELP